MQRLKWVAMVLLILGFFAPMAEAQNSSPDVPGVPLESAPDDAPAVTNPNPERSWFTPNRVPDPQKPDRVIALDLATFPSGEYRPDVLFKGGAVSAQFVFRNALPASRYSINAQSVQFEQGPLQQESVFLASLSSNDQNRLREFGDDIFGTEPTMTDGLRGTRPPQCLFPPRTVRDALDELNSESGISRAQIQLLGEIKKAFQDNFNEVSANLTPEQSNDLLSRIPSAFESCADSIISEFAEQTTITTELYLLRRDASFTLSIDRQDGEGNTVSRKVIIPAHPSGKWQLMYGFAYLLDRNESFFTEPVANQSGKYRIREKEGNSDDLNLVPTIIYSWQSESARRGGFVAGLSADLEDIAVLAGWQWTWHENIGALVGLAANQRTVLDGKYEEGQIIGESLESDALTRDTYSVTATFGLTFRFDGNIFSKIKGANNNGAPTNPPATPAPPAPPADDDTE